MGFILALCIAVTAVDGYASRDFTVKRSYDKIANHIQNDIDDVYESMGVHVIERKDGNVRAEAKTQFGRVEWNHKEKIERTAEKIVVKINASGDKFTFSATMQAEPAKKGTRIKLDANMSINDERATPKLIEIGIGKVLDKIKKHLKDHK